MRNIKQHTESPTVQAIYQSYVDARDPAHRLHLGGSQIGHHCDRFLFYQFRWSDHEEFPGRILRLFDSGNHQEPRLVKDLRATGASVYDIDPETERQFTFTAFGGHFQISIDGCIQGIAESSAWHVLEIKTANDRSFKSTKKHGAEKDKPQHYVQMQVGMHMSGMKRALYLIVNKNDDEIYAERVRYDKKLAEKYMDRAERVVFSESPLERVSNRPDWYECKFCDLWNVCHGQKVAEVNCRTCVHSTAERDGTWSCAKYGKTLSEKDQREGCDRHLMRPDLVPYTQATDAGDDWIEYDSGSFYNHCDGSTAGRNCYTSHEMRADERLPNNA